MKKIFGIGLALMMCFAFVVPAMAVDQVKPDVTATKTITIEEELYNSADVDLKGLFDKEKWIYIETSKQINIDFDGHTIEVKADGEAETFGSQINTENYYDDAGITTTDTTTTTTPVEIKTNHGRDTIIEYETTTTTTTTFTPNERDASIEASINNNASVVGVNQSPGNMNNQANLAAMAVVAGDAQLIEANGFAVQASLFNELYSDQSVNSSSMDGSVNTNTGIVGVNQSSGNMNNQFNSAAMAAGLETRDTVGALGEATLKQVSTDNLLTHVAVLRTDTISGSIIGNKGVVSVNQASGDMVNQANVCAIAAKLQ